MQKIRELLIDGLLYSFPLIVAVWLFSTLYEIASDFSKPVQNLLPKHGILAVAAVDIAIIATGIMLLLVLGLFAGSRVGKKSARAVEAILLKKIPGYPLFKSLVSAFSETRKEKGFKSVLIEFDDYKTLGILIEVHEESASVYIPSAPAPATGNIVIVETKRIVVLEASVTETLGAFSHFGLGTHELLKQAG